MNVIINPGQDILAGEKSKEAYYKDSAQFLNAGEKAAYEGGEGSGGTLAFLTRGIPDHFVRRTTCLDQKILLLGIQQLATRSMDDALRSFDGVLAEKPTNIVALLGKVCKLACNRVLLEADHILGSNIIRPTAVPSSPETLPASLAI